MDDTEAGKRFFDISVADISMGSGHFLIAAVDRIERSLQKYLANRIIPGVNDELARLRSTALNALGPLAEGVDIEDSMLLRRQIARRCIYGIDTNPMAVQLARVSMWIHSFVPGLPFSMLDHHLRQGDSIIGIGSLEEAKKIMSEAIPYPLFLSKVDALINDASKTMNEMRSASDATVAEIKDAREILEESTEKIQPINSMFNILTASRIDTQVAEDIFEELDDWMEDLDSISHSDIHKVANNILSITTPLHFPIAFPEVFTRENPGFNVIVGNPPWEKLIHKEDSFWSRYFPGFSSQPQRKREELTSEYRTRRKDLYDGLQEEVKSAALSRAALLKGDYPGIGRGDPDLYLAFAWRMYNLLSKEGRLGVVFPRSLWNSAGGFKFRDTILNNCSISDITFLLNNKHWVFENIHPQYTIALSSIHKSTADAKVQYQGPYASKPEYDARLNDSPAIMKTSEIREWSADSLLPLLSNSQSLDVYRQLRKWPSLTSPELRTISARPHRELDSNLDKPLMTMTAEQPEGFWPVYKGESFNIWEPDRGENHYYAWIDPEKAVNHLQAKRLRSANNKKSAFYGTDKQYLEDESTLPCKNPRIAIRKVTNRTNSRTTICSLIPPNIVLQDGAPYLLMQHGSSRDAAYLVGIISSIPFDWMARTITEINMTYQILRSLSVAPPTNNPDLASYVTSLAGRLASPDERFADWASAVGVEYGPLDQDEKENMIHELDAAVAHMYGLSESQLIHIFETFHVGWDYHERLQRTLEHFQNLKQYL